MKSKASVNYKAVSSILLVTWLVMPAIVSVSGAVLQPALVMMVALALFSFSFILKSKPSKPTSIAGKILIITSLLSIILLLISDGLALAPVQSLPLLLGLASGIYLELISPNKRLRKWMFLAIATKIQFVLVASMIELAEQGSLELFFDYGVFWSLVVLMGLGVPLLALGRLGLYRVAVWSTTLVAIVLVGSVFAVQPPMTVAALAGLVLLWPVVTERVIGRWIFFGQASVESQ